MFAHVCKFQLQPLRCTQNPTTTDREGQSEINSPKQTIEWQIGRTECNEYADKHKHAYIYTRTKRKHNPGYQRGQQSHHTERSVTMSGHREVKQTVH